MAQLRMKFRLPRSPANPARDFAMFINSKRVGTDLNRGVQLFVTLSSAYIFINHIALTLEFRTLSSLMNTSTFSLPVAAQNTFPAGNEVLKSWKLQKKVD